MGQEELDQAPEAEPGDSTTHAAKWKRILECGRPDYLDFTVLNEWTMPDGKVVTAFAPERDRNREEVQRVARRIYEGAATVDEQRQVVKDYVAQFPHLAFDPNSWFWNVYWTAKAGGVEKQLLTADELLSAVANGIKAKAPAWMTKQQFKAKLIEQAHRDLAQLKRRRRWCVLFHQSREARSRHPEVAEKAKQRFLVPIIKDLKTRTGYETSADELLDQGLAVVLARAVAKKYSTPIVKVSERDLH